MARDKPVPPLGRFLAKPHVCSKIRKQYIFASEELEATRETSYTYQTYPVVFSRSKPRLARALSHQTHNGHWHSARRLRQVHNRKCPVEEGESMGWITD